MGGAVFVKLKQGHLMLEKRATLGTSTELWECNQGKRKPDSSAPFELAAVLLGVYFLVATGLTVVLDIYPQAVIVAPEIFPALILVGVTVLALRSGHRKNEAISLYGLGLVYLRCDEPSVVKAGSAYTKALELLEGVRHYFLVDGNESATWWMT
jgi:hypothetical protein